jgi:hypothetical protein
MDAIKEGSAMTHRWTDEDLQQVKVKRVRAEGRSVKEQARAPIGALAAPSPKNPPYKSKLELAWSGSRSGAWSGSR